MWFGGEKQLYIKSQVGLTWGISPTLYQSQRKGAGAIRDSDRPGLGLIPRVLTRSWHNSTERLIRTTGSVCVGGAISQRKAGDVIRSGGEGMLTTLTAVAYSIMNITVYTIRAPWNNMDSVKNGQTSHDIGKSYRCSWLMTTRVHIRENWKQNSGKPRLHRVQVYGAHLF